MSHVNQYLVTFAANYMLALYGLLEGYTTPTLPQLRQPDTGLGVTDEQASWIASVFLLGIALGTPLQGPALAFGRRRSLLLVSPVLFLAALMLTFPSNVATLMAGRALLGVALGAVLPTPHVYISETVDPQLRGALVGSGMLSINASLVFVYSLGFVLSWRQIGGCIAIAAGIYPLLLWRLPESPNWLATHGRDAEALRSLRFYSSGSGETDERELERIRSRALQNQNPDLPALKDMMRRGFYMPLIVSVIVTVCKAASGTPAIHLYSYDLFRSVGGHVDPLQASVGVAALSSVGSFLAFVLLDRAGRRCLFLFSLTICGLCWTSVALASWLSVNLLLIDWVAVLGFLTALFVYNIGLGPVGMCIMGEVIPIHYRTIISPIQSMCMWIASFAIVKTFYQLRDQLQFFGLCFTYAGLCFTFVALGYFLVPETKGKTLSEIEDMFDSGGLTNKSRPNGHYQTLDDQVELTSTDQTALTRA